MLYVKKDVTEEQLKKYGFKKCKRPYDMCYYLCVPKGFKMIFIGKYVEVFDWNDDDPRIHANPNCRFKDTRFVQDILYDMIVDGIIGKVNGYGSNLD